MLRADTVADGSVAAVGRAVDLSRSFAEFDQANPEVWTMFQRFAWKAYDAGHRHLSADMILHRIRWETTVVRSDHSFKVNNNFAAFYARKLMKAEPTFAGFFRTRRSVADATE